MKTPGWSETLENCSLIFTRHRWQAAPAEVEYETIPSVIEKLTRVAMAVAALERKGYGL